jgi:hypothetical protein
VKLLGATQTVSTKNLTTSELVVSAARPDIEKVLSEVKKHITS